MPQKVNLSQQQLQQLNFLFQEYITLPYNSAILGSNSMNIKVRGGEQDMLLKIYTNEALWLNEHTALEKLKKSPYVPQLYLKGFCSIYPFIFNKNQYPYWLLREFITGINIDATLFNEKHREVCEHLQKLCENATSENVVMGDPKLENMIWERNNILKWIDFGWCKYVEKPDELVSICNSIFFHGVQKRLQALIESCAIH